MNKRELTIASIVSLVLGASVIMGLYALGLFSLRWPSSAADAGRFSASEQPATEAVVESPVLATQESGVAVASSEPTAPLPQPTSTGSPTQASPSADPTLPPLAQGDTKGEDLEDVLLLYDPGKESSFDINFCKIAEYYGLACKRLTLDSSDLTDGLLRDARGDYFKLVAADAQTILQESPLLTGEERDALKTAVEAGGVNLLIAKAGDPSNDAFLAELTGGAIQGIAKPQDSQRNWIVSSEAPEITRELTGQAFSSTTTLPPEEHAIVLGQQDSVTTLMAGTDDGGMAYPIFVRWRSDAGSIYIDAGQRMDSLEDVYLAEMYYEEHRLSEVLPLMLTMRYVLGDEAWHNDHNYANLTIDDPALTEPWHDLSFVDLLEEMKAHDFHTTIAFIPVNWNTSEPRVVSLFRQNPDRYSLVQHGNNHDGYEFYKYEVTEADPEPARPFIEQEADIREGLTRLEQHRQSTGIPYGRVMVFPYGISPERTLVLLKQYNFLATVNAQDVPLDATRPNDWDYGMYQASLDYGNFPTLTRRHPGTYYPFVPGIDRFILDLFIDKPALFYSHWGEVFETGMDAFNPVADQLNGLQGEVEWHGLGYIIEHLYLEKAEDDGSVSVQMVGNQLLLTNESGDEKTYHICKEETQNVAIASVTVNGHEFPYTVDAGLFTLDVRVPAGSSLDIRIVYGDTAS